MGFLNWPLMQAVVFGDCAGWLHPAPGQHGVVLCNAFGYDELCTHRAWLQLAERLAVQQMPTLRFDYPGTGNSLHVEEDPDRVDAWIGSIADALAYLRTVSGVQRVSLCGFRLGAMLAALAAERLSGIDGLVLLAPVLSGKKYLRELHAHHHRWLSARAHMSMCKAPESMRTVGAFGFGLHGDDIDRIGGIDLGNDTTAPARRVLLLEANDRNSGNALSARYEAYGAAVERAPFDELDHFLVEARFSKLPARAFATVSAWLAGDVDGNGNIDASPASLRTLNQSASRAIPVVPTLAGPNFMEQPVSVGACFGVYCRPRVALENAPTVLFPNTAANHNIGDGRCFVLFARRLAAIGIASLRMDLAGLGDSAPEECTITAESLHSQEACADVIAGANWLLEQGYTAVVTFGICSGAFVGLHACAAHPQIVGAFGVNLQQFVWQDEVRVRNSGAIASNRTLRRAALSTDKWKRVWSDKASLAGMVRGLVARATRRFERRVADLMDATIGWSFSPNKARRLLELLHEKDAEVRLLYGEFDHGIDELKLQFGANLRGLRRFPHVRVAMLPIVDHSLFMRAAREAAMSDAQRWLLERFCSLPDTSSDTPYPPQAKMPPTPTVEP
ncbi:serine aminopeptidase domain-containing protein [Paraburkholderia youngii]|uniref:serine aminopeptidase domain-containing protein n=1 Tax=Paraburkholderia youngii TaxID=2782701 RepID=UPI003D204957